jgi:exodeoxyribonuclease VII large subunit
VGALLLAFEQLKARLAREGLFDQERKRRIPFLPRVVGVVTSPTGAVIRDMLQILGRRFPNLQVVVRPVKVQGEGAAEEISQAIEDLNQWPGVDVIVVARGGGSLEDLWAFNEEKVARAIAASKVPVVSAVGHEVDYTIADFVADLRAPTPSAAAELIVPLKADLERAILDLRTRLLHAMEKNLKDRRAHVSNFMGRLQDPRRRVRQERLLLDELLSSLQRAMKAELKLKRSLLEQRAAVLETLSPLKILGRGYSIVRRHPQREIIREASSLSKGDLLDITFHRGTALCTVESASE